MRTKMCVFLLCLFATAAYAQGNRRLSSFFSEVYVKKYFQYAHVNASKYNGIDVEDISNNKVTIKASFEPNLIGSTYVCTIYVYFDNKGRFVHVDSHCDSPSRLMWPCFDSATSDIKEKCKKTNRNKRAIEFMERYYGKSFRQFNGHEAMCTLLNIAWFNYF